MSKNGLLPNLNIENFDVCESCIKGKITSKPFAKHWQSLELLELIHSNILWILENQNTQRNEILYHLN